MGLYPCHSADDSQFDRIFERIVLRKPTFSKLEAYFISLGISASMATLIEVFNAQ